MTSLLSKLTEGCAVCVYAPEDGLYLSEVCPRPMLITFSSSLLLFSHLPRTQAAGIEAIQPCLLLRALLRLQVFS